MAAAVMSAESPVHCLALRLLKRGLAGMLEPMVVQHENYQKRVTRLLGAMTADLLSRVQQDSADYDRCRVLQPSLAHACVLGEPRLGLLCMHAM